MEWDSDDRVEEDDYMVVKVQLGAFSWWWHIRMRRGEEVKRERVKTLIYLFKGFFYFYIK